MEDTLVRRREELRERVENLQAEIGKELLVGVIASDTRNSLYSCLVLHACYPLYRVRRVSTTLRHMLTEFSEFFHVSWTGLLIQASVGTTGGLGALRTKRSG